MDHQAAHSGIAGPRPADRAGRRCTEIALLRWRWPPAGTGPAPAGGSPRSGRPSAPRYASVSSAPLHPVDPEVAPVQQPVGQPLDLVERALQTWRCSRSPSPSGAPCSGPRRRSPPPGSAGSAARARPGQAPTATQPTGDSVWSAAHHDDDGDERQQVGDDLPAQDQDLLRVLQLVPHQQGEVEERAGGEEVQARPGWPRPAGSRARAPVSR